MIFPNVFPRRPSDSAGFNLTVRPTVFPFIRLTLHRASATAPVLSTFTAGDVIALGGDLTPTPGDSLAPAAVYSLQSHFSHFDMSEANATGRWSCGDQSERRGWGEVRIKDRRRGGHGQGVHKDLLLLLVLDVSTERKTTNVLQCASHHSTVILPSDLLVSAQNKKKIDLSPNSHNKWVLFH